MVILVGSIIGDDAVEVAVVTNTERALSHMVTGQIISSRSSLISSSRVLLFSFCFASLEVQGFSICL